MKESFEIIIAVFATIILVHYLINAATDTVEEEELTGYINPEAKNTIEWVQRSILGYYPIERVEVTLSTGKKINAEIPINLDEFCVKYRDYPETKGRRVVVSLKKEDGEYRIISGEIEE